MNLLYDPKKRQPKPWTIVLILIIPVVLVLIFFNIGKNMKSEYFVDEKELDVKVDDVFEKF